MTTTDKTPAEMGDAEWLLEWASAARTQPGTDEDADRLEVIARRLEASAQAEPTVWQHRVRLGDGKFSDWMPGKALEWKHSRPTEYGALVEVRPLYAAPPAPEADALLQQALQEAVHRYPHARDAIAFIQIASGSAIRTPSEKDWEWALKRVDLIETGGDR